MKTCRSNVILIAGIAVLLVALVLVAVFCRKGRDYRAEAIECAKADMLHAEEYAISAEPMETWDGRIAYLVHYVDSNNHLNVGIAVLTDGEWEFAGYYWE